MNFSEWKKALRAALDDMPDDEVDSALDYYKEMFADMSELGRSERDIIAEFGTPSDCADKIRRECGDLKAVKSDENTEEKANTPHTVLNSEQKAEKSADSESNKKRRISVGEAIGIFFFSLILVLPLAAAAFGAVAAFGACAISGGLIALGGALLCAASPAVLLLGYGTGELILVLGGGITMIGIGGLLAVGFFLATKYTAKGTLAFLRLIYRRF